MENLKRMENLVTDSLYNGKNSYLASVLQTYKEEAEYSLNGPLYANYQRGGEFGIAERLHMKLVPAVNHTDLSKSSSGSYIKNSMERKGVNNINGTVNQSEYNSAKIKRPNSPENIKILSVPRIKTESQHVECKMEKLNVKKERVSRIDNISRSDAGPYVVPVLLPSDQSAVELSETKVEGYSIFGFSVGGEMRLCLPQVINIILDRFSVDEIRPVYDELHVFCALCTSAQLEILKRAGILPAGAPSCGLITKTDAERLCARLLHVNSSSQKCDRAAVRKSEQSLRVTHECFGRCFGVFHSMDYVSESSVCVSCVDCGKDFSPAQFVCHSHMSQENRVVHWGFDSEKWRNYLMIDEDWYERKNDKEQTYDWAVDLFGKIKKGIASNDLKRKLTIGADKEVDELSKIKRFRSSTPNKRPEISATIKHGGDSSVTRKDSTTRAQDRSLVSDHSSVRLLLEQTLLALLDRIFFKYSRRVSSSSVQKDQYNTIQENKFEPNVSLPADKPESSDHALNKDNKKLERSEGVWPGRGASVPVGLEAKLSAVLSAELTVFRSALIHGAEDQSPSERRATSEAALKEFMSLQETDLELVTDLLQTYRKLQQDLKYMYRVLNDTEGEMKQEAVERDRQMMELKVAQERKLIYAEAEITKLKTEIESMVQGNKRSDVGLMKARYKAQAEHFRRKLHSADQQNKDLHKELRELRGLAQGVTGPRGASESGPGPSRLYSVSHRAGSGLKQGAEPARPDMKQGDRCRWYSHCVN